jgi:hypothetical protein
MNSASSAANSAILLGLGSGAAMGLSPAVAVAVLTVAMAANGLTTGGGFGVNHLDILPSIGGLVIGVVNMCGSVAGALAPYIMASLTPYPGGKSREQWELSGEQPTGEWLSEVSAGWRSVFNVAAAVNLLSLVVFAAFASGVPLAWAPHVAPRSGAKPPPSWQPIH